MPRLKGKKRGRGMVAVRSLQEPFDWFPGFHPGPPTSPLSSGCSLLSTYQRRDPAEQESAVCYSSVKALQ